jgi:hypothetical protein
MRKHSNKKATRKAAQPRWSVGLRTAEGDGRLVDNGGRGYYNSAVPEAH